MANFLLVHGECGSIDLLIHMINPCEVYTDTLRPLKTGCATISLLSLSLAFWHKDSSAYQDETRNESGSHNGSTREALKLRVTWIGALYFFVYFGAQSKSPSPHTISQ